MSFPADTLSWFRAKQSLLLLLHTASLVQKQQIPILVFDLNRPGLKPMDQGSNPWTSAQTHGSGLKPMIYHTQGVHANNYITDTV
jgi:hypothetical protein